MNSSMSQKKNLIKLIIVIPYFRWNAQRKAFGTNAQPRIASYGSSRGLGTSPTRKIPMQPGKLHRYFCLCIYKGPARQVCFLILPFATTNNTLPIFFPVFLLVIWNFLSRTLTAIWTLIKWISHIPPNRERTNVKIWNIERL